MCLAHPKNFGISLCFDLADVLFFKFFKIMTIINFWRAIPLNPQNIIPIKFNHHNYNKGLIFRHFWGISVSVNDRLSNNQNHLILDAIFDTPCARASLYFLKRFLF